MKFDKAEKYRSKHPMGFQHEAGNNFGWFKLLSEYDRQWLMVMACERGPEIDWDHVSVSKENGKTPNWREMCQVKDLFWDENDVVVQFHPKKKDYVNIAKNCLHLWCYRKAEFPIPPKWSV